MSTQKGQDEHGEPSTEKAPELPPVEPAPGGVAHKEGETQKPESDDAAIRKLSDRINWLTVLNVLVSIATVVQTSFSCRALDLTREANELTRESLAFAKKESDESSEDVKSALKQSTRAADAAEAASKAAGESARLTQEQLVLSERSLKSGERLARNRERPWLVKVDEPTKWVPGKAQHLEVSFRNVGSLPAVDVRFRAYFIIGTRFPDIAKLDEVAEGKALGQSSVGPNANTVQTIDHKAIGPDVVREVMSGRVTAFVYGVVTYKGPGSPTVHESELCSYWSLQFRGWSNCESRNDAR